MTEKLPDGFELIPDANKPISSSQLPQGFELIGHPDQLSTNQIETPPAQAQVIQEQQIDGYTGAATKSPKDKSMMELVGDKLENWGAGLGERATTLGGNLLQAIQTTGEGIEKEFPLGGLAWEEGDILPSIKSPEEFAALTSDPILAQGAKVLKDVKFGYKEGANWQGVKKAFSEGGPLSGSAYAEVLEYSAEQGIKSIPDMAASMFALPAYVLARSGEMGEKRAINKGKEKAELEDILEAAPFATASAILEKIGAKAMTSGAKESLGRDILKSGIKAQSKRVAKAGGVALTKEAATEAMQEGMVEYIGERYGTNAKMKLEEALDQAAAGAVAGGVFGGTVGASSRAVGESMYSPEKVIANAMEEELAKKYFSIDEKPKQESVDIDLPKKEIKDKAESLKKVSESVKPEEAPKKSGVESEYTGVTSTRNKAYYKESDTLLDSEMNLNQSAYDEQNENLEESITEDEYNDWQNSGWEKSTQIPLSNSDSNKVIKKITDTTLYHGSPDEDIESLELKSEEGALFVTYNEGTAEAYADDGKVYSVSIEPVKPFYVEHSDLTADMEGSGTIAALKKQGYDSIVPLDSGDIVILKDSIIKRELKEKREVMQITESTTPKTLNSKAVADVKGKSTTIKNLESLDQKELNEVAKTPTPSAPKEKTAEQVYEQQVYSNVAMSSAITTSEYNQTMEDQTKTIVGEQSQLDIEKAANNAVQEASMSEGGKVTYPKPKEDINTQQYRKFDNKIVKPPGAGQRIFNAPGHNYVGLFRSTGIPERRSFVMIEGRKLNVPEEPQRIEPIMAKLIKIMGRRIYFGKIKGKSSEGFYRPGVGEIRTRKKNDVEVLAHEMAHYLDFYSNITLPNFKKLYQDPKFVDEVKALSYTDADNKIMEIEGFAEFVRLWLTNSQEALIRAPKFYNAFTNLMARDRKLLNPMRDMQDLMHKFYFQGPDKLGQALIGKDKSFSQRFNEWAYRRDSRIRQQTIDRFHASRKVEQELTDKIGTVQESAWKQFRLANGGSEGISDYIMNYGTVNFDEKGDLQRTGQSLHEVLQPVKTIKLKPEHKSDQKIDVLLRYFAGRRALELHRQGRENLIPKETAKEWARLGKDYPVFESIQKNYQEFNDRMMDFYEEAGMITPEGRQSMSKMNKDYVPFNRIRDQLAGGPTGVGGGFQKLKGGTANLNDILVNIQDGITANVRSALSNRAKQRLYQYISNHKDGAIFATKLAPDSKPVQVYSDEMQSKIGKILELNGVVIDGDLDLGSKDLLTFWQHGVKPQLNESGNIVDSVIINGKPKYYEVQDPLLQEMLISMNPESYSSFMNVMFGVKNFFTRMITLGVEFTGANLVRDTVGASFLSKNDFKPFLDSFKGMYSFISKDEHYQKFIKSGAGYSSRLEATTKEGTARRRVKLDEFGVMSMPEKLLSTIDNIASAFEYGTRIGEFRLAKKNMKSDMDAGFEAREISTDFSVLGANRFLTGYIRTVPFLNAMIQSQDRVFREAVVGKKYDGNPTGLAMKAFLGITVPTLILYLVNKDDEEYKAIPDYEKRTNWHIKIGDNQFVKIPRPYDVGFVYATMPELFAKYVEDDKGKEFADGMIWTMTQMYGIDGVPAMMTGWWDLVRNKKWTGAPVVPKALSDVEATEQYSSNTAETFIRMGEALGVSPVKAEHMFKSYTGYLGGYLLWGTDHMLWDEEKFGEKPDSQTSDNIFLKRFLTPDTRPATAAMEKFFELKEKSDKIVSTFKQQTDIRRAIKGQIKKESKFKDDNFFGLSGKEKQVLFALNDSMNQLIKLMYGKEGVKTAELKVKHNKKLTGKQKREELDKLWNSRNDAFMKYYLQADKAMQKAKQQSEKFK